MGRYLPLMAVVSLAGGLAAALAVPVVPAAGPAGTGPRPPVRAGTLVAPQAIAPAFPGPPPRRVTVVLVPGLAPEDVLRGGDGAGWAGAALALVTPQAGEGTGSPWATLAAGAVAAGGAEAGWAFMAGEPVPALGDRPAGQVYRSLTGRPPGGAAAFHLGLAALQEANRVRGRPVRFGALAEGLRRRGRVTAALGNGDLPGSPARAGALLAADPYGRIAHARLGREVLRPDPELPAGVATDWRRIRQALASLPAAVALAVVEVGDLARVDAVRELLGPDRHAALRERLVARVRAEVASLARQERRRGHAVWLLNPVPPAGDRARQGMGVSVLWTPGPPGEAAWLASPSTRRVGVIALVDVVPSLAAWLGVGPLPGVTGRPAGVVPAPPGAAAELLALAEALQDNHERRVPLLKGYVLAQIGLAILAGAALFRWRLHGLVRPALLASTLVPAAYLLLPLLPWRGPWAAGAAVVAATAAGAALLARAGRRAPYLAYAVSALAAVALVFADLLTGGRLVVRSPLGYSLIGGARFYGIGNEYEGVVLGAGLVATGGALQAAGLPTPVARAVWWGVGLSLLCALGSPRLGADFGGTLAGAAGLAAATLGRPGRLGLRHAAGVGGLVLLAGALLVAADYRAGATATHVGLATLRVAHEGWPALLDIVHRKLALNVRLIRYTIWSRALIALLLLLLLALLEPRGRLRRLAAELPQLFAALRGAVVAGLAALVLNDSGVVAAATALIYPAAVTADLVAARGSPPHGRVIDTRGGGP